mgnify:CR=1 FL=1
MNSLALKFKEVLFSVLPITLIVLILNFTLTPLDTPLLIRFIMGAVLIIIGLSVFLFGIDISVTPVGNALGSTVAKSNKLWIVAIVGLVSGFIISMAEPDLHILAGQVEFVTSGAITKILIVAVVSVGIGAMMSTGIMRIVLNFPLYKLFTILYLIILALGVFTQPEFLAISFDASGATTGAMTVPFMLAVAGGVSALKKDSKSSEKDSFGLVGIASAGAIIAVMVMGLFTEGDKAAAGIGHTVPSTSIIEPFIQKLPRIALEMFIALLPIALIFVALQGFSVKMSKRSVIRISAGLGFTFVGLVLFMVGVNAGFMDVGAVVGYNIASLDNKAYAVIIGFVLGLVTVLAEPAVYVLTHQIEDVTSGYVKRKVVMLFLCLGVGVAGALSIVRILVPSIQLWHYLLPGYIISIAMMYFTPKLFVGIAFDSGGVASGPMTATFILAYAQGAANAAEGANVLAEGFGMIAMVALTPLIALQLLGIIFKIKSKKGGTDNAG